MIITLIVEHYWLVIPALVAGALLAVGVAFLLTRWGQHGRVAAWIIAGIASLGVLVLTLIPDGVGASFGHCNLTHVFAPTEVSNITLFFLPVLYASVASGKPLLAGAGGVLVSAAIEVTQSLLPVIGRRCDINDLLNNSLGSILAALIALALLRLADYRARQQDREQTDTTSP